MCDIFWLIFYVISIKFLPKMSDVTVKIIPSFLTLIKLHARQFWQYIWSFLFFTKCDTYFIINKNFISTLFVLWHVVCKKNQAWIWTSMTFQVMMRKAFHLCATNLVCATFSLDLWQFYYFSGIIFPIILKLFLTMTRFFLIMCDNITINCDIFSSIWPTMCIENLPLTEAFLYYFW